MTRTFWCVSFALLFITVECSEDQSIADALSMLQLQVRTLQRARARDQITILQLRSKLTSSHISNKTGMDNEESSDKSSDAKILEDEHRNLVQLEVQLEELKKHLAEMVELKEREARSAGDVGEVRGELDSLRAEVLKLRQELEVVSSRKQEDIAAGQGRARAEQVTTRWLQKTVEELRAEMREVASSVNVSAALLRGQRADGHWTAARSDLAALRADLEDLRAGQKRTGAKVEQLQQEVGEVRAAEQKLAVGHQELANEVNSMQSEGLASTGRASEDIRTGEGSGDLESARDWQIDNEEFHPVHQHRMRHRHQQQIKLELTKLRVATTEQTAKQKTFARDLIILTETFKTLNNSVSVLHGQDNQRRLMGEVLDMRTRIEVLEVLEKEGQEDRNGSQVTIGKLHHSTVKLFQALETVEDEYGKSVADIRKEVSKCEFNLAQMQSASKVVRQDLTTLQDLQKSMKKDTSQLRGEVQRDHYRLLTVQNEVLNRSLQGCRDRNEDSMRDLKISHLERESSRLKSRIDEYHAALSRIREQLGSKADESARSKWEVAMTRLRKDFEDLIHKQVPELGNITRRVEKELGKFVGKLPQDCTMSDVMTPPTQYHSGIYLIRSPISNSSSLETYCDMDTARGHWTTIQRRTDGTVNFYRDWDEYRRGFGIPEGEFWIGNDNLHALTTSTNYSLRIDMWDTWGKYKYAEYENFEVGSEPDGFPLKVNGYAGNASDALEYHNAMRFSTKDRDNDASSTHCAVYYSSGWWYNHCQYVNVNGRYNVGLTWYDIDAHEWVQLNRVEMKIRPKGWNNR